MARFACTNFAVGPLRVRLPGSLGYRVGSTIMRFVIQSGLTALCLFLASLALLAVGRRVGERRLEADPAGGSAGHAAVEAAVFGLLGLLLAFTFSGAMQRFDERRQLIGEEARAIATAYWQADLLTPAARPKLRDRRSPSPET